MTYEPITINDGAIHELEREKASAWIKHLMKYAEKQMEEPKQQHTETVPKSLDDIVKGTAIVYKGKHE